MELNLSAPNSQSFDQVLQKLKQSMKAARTGGWIDSDSGSELELTLDHSSNGNLAGHPCHRDSPTRSNHQQAYLYIKDEIDHQRNLVKDQTNSTTPLWSNRKTINPRVSELSHLTTHPLTTSSLKYHSIDPISLSLSQDSRISPIFDASNNNNPYIPRTPSTPVSNATSAGSPYVRHHFKWEFLPPTTTGQGFNIPGSQPRFVESSSPPLKINHDELYSDWSRGFLTKESIFSNESNQLQRYHDSRSDFEIQPPTIHRNHPATMLNGYRSVSYSPTYEKSQSIPIGVGMPRSSALENSNTNTLKTGSPELPRKFCISGISSQGQKPHSQAPLNPASVSSVSFSLAPAAPIRLTAPEVNSQVESLGRKETTLPPSTHINPPTTISREPNDVTTHATVSPTNSSVHSKDFNQEKEKEVIRARLMGSSSIDEFQTHFQNVNKRYAENSKPVVDHLAQISNLPSLFQKMSFSNTTQSNPSPHSMSESTPIRSISASYPSTQNYCAPIFYSSHPHGTTVSKRPSFTVTSSGAPSPNDLFKTNPLTPGTPVTPIGFTPNAQLHAPISSMPYPPTPSANNKTPFASSIVPAVPGLGGAVGTPLPGQVQPEEVRKSVKAQPPVVNTGNSGAMIPQPGDWMCICGFVNWRRRKVCMRCFPFADGNDSVGAMMALNAQRAALLAAGIPMTKDHSNSTGVNSNSSSNFFQSSESPCYPGLGKQIIDQKAKFNRIFTSPEPAFNCGVILEPRNIFTSPPGQGMTMNPFDKPTSLGPISPNSKKNPQHSSDDETNERYTDELSPKSLDQSYSINPIERSSEALRTRLVGSGEEMKGHHWDESTSKSPRPRSFSMGDKSEWDLNDILGPTGQSVASEIKNSNKSDQNLVEKETNGIHVSEEAVSGHAANSRMLPGRYQELNTISNNVTSLNRQRTITSPASSWQAIKALWQ